MGVLDRKNSISFLKQLKKDIHLLITTTIEHDLVLPREDEEKLNEFLDDLKSVSKADKISVGDELKIIMD